MTVAKFFMSLQQEENNNIPNCAADEASGNSATHQKSAQVMLEMRSLKYTIAAANPILAEKLATPSEQNIQPSNNGSRPQLAPLTPKVEKGRYLISVISCITCDRGKTV